MKLALKTVHAPTFHWTSAGMVALLVVGAPQAQGTALEWELAGSAGSELSGSEVEGFGFRLGSDPLGTMDTLFAVSGGVFRLGPGDGDWVPMCTSAWCSTDYMEVTSEGYLLIGSTAGPASDGERSVDGGRTWEHEVVGVSVAVLFQSTLPSLGGAFFACNGAYCARSYEGGAMGSWIAGGPMGGAPAALAEVYPSPLLPAGRMLGGAWNGAAYSDDAGITWIPSSLWQPGRYVVTSLAFLRLPNHPYGGLAFAGVADAAVGLPGIYRSEDGGSTWALVRRIEMGEFGLADPNWLRVGVDPRPGGAVYAGVEDNVPGTDADLGTVLRSPDGGATWEPVADSALGWGGFAVYGLKVARDGRLYVGTERGVWRTVQPLPVASETTPGHPSRQGHTIEVAPNPTSGVFSVRLNTANAGRAHVYAVDLSGRVVAIIFDRTVMEGTRELWWDARGVAPGVYLLIADVNGRRVSRRIVISGP